MKIDVVAGLGVGALGAIFAAIDGHARLWEPGGFWRGAAVRRLYRWRPAYRLAAAFATLVVVILAAPLAVVVAAGTVSLGALVLGVAGLAVAPGLAGLSGAVLTIAFGPTGLPAVLPRLVSLVLATSVLVAVAGAARRRLRARRRPSRESAGWRLVGPPLAASGAVDATSAALWQLVRGAAPVAQPSLVDLGRRYTELLSENLGQPGFREIVLTAHDLDTRRDLVFALLADPHRLPFFARQPGDDGRAAETFDLAGVGRDHASDALAGALSIPLATEPHRTTFSPESYWCGETHRLCGRVEAVGRLLAEVSRAGAEQAVVVSAVGELAGPHALSAPPGDARGWLGECIAAADTAAVRDALALAGPRFRAVFLVRPAHNAIGPFDLGGRYDDRSDRHQPLAELVDRGYEDVYRQFIEPVVGASGERLGRLGGVRS